MRAASRRRAPNSACHACRRLKMRCVRISPSSCERCLRVSRTCVAIVISETSSNADEQTPAPAPARGNDDVAAASCVLDATPTRAFGTIPASLLPSIYSTSPAVNHRLDDQNTLLIDLGPLCHDDSVFSARDVAQWLQMHFLPIIRSPFRDKLLSTASVLEPTDFDNSDKLLKESFNLVTCIVYVTSRYVPGYNTLRNSLKGRIERFLQSTFNQASPSPEKQAADLQALIILYMFTRSGAIERTADKHSSSVDFWSVKATCEVQALRMVLHRTAESLCKRLRAGDGIRRSDDLVKLYFYQLWFFSTSHHVAIVTGTPPTIMADASIRAAPSLLESLRYDPAVIITVAETELCLAWYTLGAKDPTIKEWWCPPTIQELATGPSSPLSHHDIDAVLANCKHRMWLKHNTTLDPTAVLSMSPDYYLHYTKFCLNTFFLPQAGSNTAPGTSIDAVARCVDSALSVLSLSSSIGPAGRDQLRYFPGFLFVMLSYCSTFVLKAIQAYPDIAPHSAAALDTVRKIADFMVDLRLERGHGGDAFTAGQSVLREISRFQRGSQVHPPTQQPSPAPSLFHSEQTQGEQQWLQDVFDQQFLDSGYSFPWWDERFNFG